MPAPLFLNIGDELLKGHTLISPNQVYSFIFQYDGNCVLYEENKAIWATNTCGKHSKTMKMQKDGNLVLYDDWGKALWASNTVGKGGLTMIVQDNGDLGLWTKDQSQVWREGTNIGLFSGLYEHDRLPIGATLPSHGGIMGRTGVFAYKLDHEGNLLYEKNSKAIASENISGGKYLAMQNDGNLVCYDDNNKALWASNTYGSGAKAVVCTNDGRIVLVDDPHVSQADVDKHIIHTIRKFDLSKY